MKYLVLPLLPSYVPFEVNCCKADGTKYDPTSISLNVYEEGGADGTFDNSAITGSPFTPAKINSKTGDYGVLIAKSSFTAGKIYRLLWEATVDGTDSHWVETYLATNKKWLTLVAGGYEA
jgi:hypothetical protein